MKSEKTFIHLPFMIVAESNPNRTAEIEQLLDDILLRRFIFISILPKLLSKLFTTLCLSGTIKKFCQNIKHTSSLSVIESHIIYTTVRRYLKR